MNSNSFSHPAIFLRSVVGTVLCWVLNVVSWTIYVIFSVVTLRRFTDSVFPTLAHLWSRGILFLLGVRIESRGEERMASQQPRIVVVNHQSSLDLIWPAMHFPRGAFAIGKREIAYIPFFNLMWWSAGCTFIDRKHHRRALRQLRTIAARIRAKKASVYIAPEGTRTRDGMLLPFKRGAFLIALEAKVPIYPVVADGGFEVLPWNRYIASPGVIRVHYLPPIDTTDWTHENLSERVAQVRSLMGAELERMRSSVDSHTISSALAESVVERANG